MSTIERLAEKDGPEEIFLQPTCCASPDIGRLWCEHDAPENCEDGRYWTRYIRSDIHAALIADVRRQAMEEAAVAAEAKGKHSILCDCTTCLIRHEIAYGIRARLEEGK